MTTKDTFNSKQVEFHKQDPLKDQDATRRELFGRMSKAANNFEQRDVVYAAVNLILNAIRQQCPKQKEAEALFDELMAHGKRTLLDQHYFPSGQRRSVYPFHQVIEPPTIDARPKNPSRF
jgi:hypothetical protein